MPTLRAIARRRSRPSRLTVSRVGRPRTEIGGHRAEEDPGALQRGGRARHRRGVAVGREDLGRHRRPRVALGVGARGARHRGARGGVDGEVAQRLGQRRGVTARDEHAVDSVPHDVAVAGDVRRYDRRAGGEAFRQHHAEALAAERGRDEQVGRGERRMLLLVGDLAEHRDALAALEQQRVDLLAVGADDDQLDGKVLAQRLERAQQHRQPFAFDGLADEDQPQRRVGSARSLGQLRRHLDPVGHDAVLAAEEAPARPGRRFGDRDAYVQVVELALGAEHDVGEEPVAERVVRVAVEGADEGRACRVEHVVADRRRVRLVDVDDVEATCPELASQRGDRVGEQRQVRHRAVCLDPDGAAERHEPVGHLAGLWARTAMHPRGQAVGRVVGSEDANVVAAGHELPGERLDVPSHATWVRPGIRRHERYAHRSHPNGRARGRQCGKPAADTLTACPIATS
jgi:hypothetical protein